ncbi:MAG: hypothetical protein JOY70_10095, partial [Acidisphaera sp.]|nr:hypothetical protein [Acidisphaera sp.]MBV9813611.1 hypothetical protein [Acetobacteraceae bacterium]
AVATLIAGLAAVLAAFWTIRATEQSVHRQASDRRRAIAARALAIAQRIIDRKSELRRDNSIASFVLGTQAIANLSADVGLLGFHATQIFTKVEEASLEARLRSEQMSSSSSITAGGVRVQYEVAVDGLEAACQQLKRLCIPIYEGKP